MLVLALDEVPTEVPSASIADPDDDAAALRPFVARVHRFLRCLGASRAEAEDLTQEAFLVAARKGKLDLAPPARLSFFRRTARFLWLQTRRRERRAEAAIAELALQTWEQELPDDGDAMLAATQACVQQLEGRAARAVAMAYGEEVGRDAIAATLGMAPNGVKTLLARTRRWLERCITRRLA